ncbi:MAG: hypothetical protein K6E50_10825 [Lachnospiraceae bacterium]|nr:hypothetical protein [Lachnospiraceae bacterium]
MEEIITVFLLFAAVAAIVAVLGFFEKKRFIRDMRAELKRTYGKRCTQEISAVRAECIPAYFREHRNDDSIDDITASDLELGRLFAEMNLCRSSAGEELLYHLLRSPLFSEEELKKRAEQISFLRENGELRDKLRLFFAMMGKNERYSLYDYLHFADTLKEDPTLRYHFVAPILLAAAVALILLKPDAGIPFLILVMVFNIAWYYRTKGKVQAYFVTLKHVMRDIRAGEKIAAMDPGPFSEECGELKAALKKLRGFKRGSGAVFSGDAQTGDPMGILADYLKMILHFDLIFFYNMIRQMQEHREEVDTVHGKLGYIEALIAVGSYMDALEDVCVPVFDKTEAAGQLYHPLIEEPVKNSYQLSGCMLLTGSNASGKSTFLKTIALNQLLAQDFYFACADEFHTEFHRIYTSMSLRDNLEQQESYFMVEIKAMQRILKAAEQPGARIACFVDEVLRGTNTVERIAASTQILRHMADKNIFCAAATHDIELTDLLEDQYENHHFEEEIKDGDVLFNYRLQNGKATSRNAIRLLSVMGYEPGIVENAEKLAEHFLKEGCWT